MHAGRNARYSSAQVLHAVLSSWAMRSPDVAINVCEHICGMMFPGLFQSHSLHSPSSSTLRRSRAHVDFGLLMLAQEQNRCLELKPNYFRYGWSDSSPIGGRNWLVSKHVAVPVKHVVLCYICARCLALDTAALAQIALEQQQNLDDESDDASRPYGVATSSWWLSDMEDPSSIASKFRDDVADGGRVGLLSSSERQKLATHLLENVRLHTHIPTSLAMGQADLTHKSASLVHQIGVETSTPEDLSCWLDGVRSWCTDMGVEAALSEVRVKPEALLPSWWQWSSWQNDQDSRSTLRLPHLSVTHWH